MASVDFMGSERVIMDITVEQITDSDSFEITLGYVRITLSKAELEALVLNATHHLPALLPDVEVAKEEDVYRIPAMRLMDMTDRDIQVFLREAPQGDLVMFLWYLDAPELTQRVFSNMSHRSREMLQGDMKDFAAAHNKLTPRLQERNTHKAIEITKNMVETLYHLNDSGYIAYE